MKQWQIPAQEQKTVNNITAKVINITLSFYKLTSYRRKATFLHCGKVFVVKANEYKNTKPKQETK